MKTVNEKVKAKDVGYDVEIDLEKDGGAIVGGGDYVGPYKEKLKILSAFPVLSGAVLDISNRQVR